MTWPQPSTHPPTHQTIHPPMGGEFFTDFKSSNRIEISWLVQVLWNFLLILGVPLGGGRWVDKGGGGYGGVGVSHALMHVHACTCMHARTCMLNMINMLNMDASMLVAICNFYTCIHVCMWGHPHAPRHPPPTCPLPRATGSPKHKNSISPELIEIIRFCLKILYLWTLLSSYRLYLVSLDTPTHLPGHPEPRKPKSK